MSMISCTGWIVTTDEVASNDRDYNRVMLLTKLRRLAPIALGGAAWPCAADVAAEVADLAVRIEYGYYAEEPRLIAAARSALELLPEQEPRVRYYRALAAFRLAQLDVDAGGAAKLFDDCIELATPIEAPPRPGARRDKSSAEGWILAAACAARAGSAKQRARDRALAEARAIDPENPRIALVETWSIGGNPRSGTDVSADRLLALTTTVERFRGWTGRPVDGPDWGEAEAFAELGALHLERGDIRRARDLIEQALLIAPDYRFASTLQSRLHRPE